MAEHFNIAVVLGHAISSEERLDILLVLAKIYAPFFNHIHEVCLNNYKDGTSQCKKWPTGENLLKTDIGSNELLFVYGGNLEQSTGSRSSFHIEESDLGTVLVISLPLLPNVDVSQLELYLLATKGAVRQLSDFFIVAAGWEFECDVTGKMEDVLQNYFADTSLCSWIAAPRRLIPDWPKTYVKVSESDQIILLKNVTST
jgi:hypothetical protein